MLKYIESQPTSPKLCDLQEGIDCSGTHLVLGKLANQRDRNDSLRDRLHKVQRTIAKVICHS